MLVFSGKSQKLFIVFTWNAPSEKDPTHKQKFAANEVATHVGWLIIVRQLRDCRRRRRLRRNPVAFPKLVWMGPVQHLETKRSQPQLLGRLETRAIEIRILSGVETGDPDPADNKDYYYPLLSWINWKLWFTSSCENSLLGPWTMQSVTRAPNRRQ